MAEVRGMLDVEQLRQAVEAGEIDTVVVAFTDLYGRMMGKRYDAEFFLESALEEGAHACDYLLTVDVDMEPVPGYAYANWEKGYGDFHLVPDLGTLRRASWLDRSAVVLCDVHDPRSHQRVPVAPRSMLRAQVDRAAARGLEAFAASELEYYLFDGSFRDVARGAAASPASWYLEDYHILQGTREEPFTAAVRRHLRDSGIPVETSKGEWGLGQHEINVRYASALDMADRHVLFKQCAKEVADAQGRSLTFMAKFDEGKAGSSCHLHLSLRKDGASAFAGEQDFGPVRCTELFRWFLGGWIAHAPEVMACYAPTVNSYKRYQSGSWAPTRLAWSHDNRTAGFRVVGAGPSLRIECRIPGADCNPYIAFAAALASGLDGIENRIEPPEMFDGDVYQAGHLPGVPTTLREATRRLRDSDFARAAFGEEVVEHYAHFLEVEQAAFDRAVTDWERRRYFEQI